MLIHLPGPPPSIFQREGVKPGPPCCRVLMYSIERCATKPWAIKDGPPRFPARGCLLRFSLTRTRKQFQIQHWFEFLREGIRIRERCGEQAARWWRITALWCIGSHLLVLFSQFSLFSSISPQAIILPNERVVVHRQSTFNRRPFVEADARTGWAHGAKYFFPGGGKKFFCSGSSFGVEVRPSLAVAALFLFFPCPSDPSPSLSRPQRHLGVFIIITRVEAGHLFVTGCSLPSRCYFEKVKVEVGINEKFTVPSLTYPPARPRRTYPPHRPFCGEVSDSTKPGEGRFPRQLSCCVRLPLHSALTSLTQRPSCASARI